jgi:hypothetical protein
LNLPRKVEYNFWGGVFYTEPNLGTQYALRRDTRLNTFAQHRLDKADILDLALYSTFMAQE